MRIFKYLSSLNTVLPTELSWRDAFRIYLRQLHVIAAWMLFSFFILTVYLETAKNRVHLGLPVISLGTVVFVALLAAIFYVALIWVIFYVGQKLILRITQFESLSTHQRSPIVLLARRTSILWSAILFSVFVIGFGAYFILVLQPRNDVAERKARAVVECKVSIQTQDWEQATGLCKDAALLASGDPAVQQLLEDARVGRLDYYYRQAEVSLDINDPYAALVALDTIIREDPSFRQATELRRQAIQALTPTETMTTTESMTATTTSAITNTVAASETEITVIDVVTDERQFEILLLALSLANLTDELKGTGPYTLFAPPDSAFAELPEATLNSFLADTTQLARVLHFHVVPKKLIAKTITNGMTVDTLMGQKLTFAVSGGNITVNGANVIGPELTASNGSVFIVDSVLLPDRSH